MALKIFTLLFPDVVTEMFLYKFFNDKFGYEAKRDKVYGERLCKAEKWDAEYDTFTEEEVEDLFSYLPASVPNQMHLLYFSKNQSGQSLILLYLYRS